MNSVVVTGVSTGIGWAATEALLAREFRVFGSVRRQVGADRLSAEFGANFTPVSFDVTDTDVVEKAADEVGAALGRTALSGLVNNAGIAVSGPLLQLPIEKLRQKLEVNLTGQMIVTRAFAPLFGTTPCAIKEGADANVDLLGSRPLSHPSAHRFRAV